MGGSAMQYGMGGAELIGGALLSLLGPTAVAGIPMMLSGAQTLAGSNTGSGSGSSGGGGGGIGSSMMSLLPLAGLFGGGGSKSAASPFAPPPQLAQAAPTQPLSLGVPQTQQQSMSTLPPVTQAALQPPQNRLPMGANQMSPDDELTAFLAARGIPT